MKIMARLILSAAMVGPAFVKVSVAAGGVAPPTFVSLPDCKSLPEGAGRETWYSAPEMQVLDDAGHADGLLPIHRAGGAHDVYAPKCNYSQ